MVLHAILSGVYPFLNFKGEFLTLITHLISHHMDYTFLQFEFAYRIYYNLMKVRRLIIYP